MATKSPSMVNWSNDGVFVGPVGRPGPGSARAEGAVVPPAVNSNESSAPGEDVPSANVDVDPSKAFASFVQTESGSNGPESEALK